MPALVTRRNYASLSKYAKYSAMRNRYARAGMTAYRVGAYAYKNRKRLRSFSRTASRVYKRARRAAPSVKQHSKVKGDIVTTLSEANQSAYQYVLQFPSINPSNQAYAQRNGPSLFVSGIKLCWDFQNLRDDQAQHVHFAILQYKGFQTSTTSWNEDFFTDNYSPGQRFSGFPPPSADYNMRLDCDGINSTKFNILTHKKFTLDPNDGVNTLFSTAKLSNGRWKKRLRMWIPLKKRIMFENPSSTVPTKPWIVVVWNQNADMRDARQVINSPCLTAKGLTKVYFK